MSENYLSEALHKPEIQAFITRKRLENIQTAALRASDRIIGLVDAESEHVAAEVSLKTLALAGHVPVERHHHRVEASLTVGYIVDLGEARRDEVVDVTPSPSAPVFVSSPAGSALDAATVPAKAELVPRPVLERPAPPADPEEIAGLQRRRGEVRVARRLRGEVDQSD